MSLLFYTAADKEYEFLAPLYIYCALSSNPQSYVEIGLENPNSYRDENKGAIDILTNKFGNRFKFSKVDFSGVLPGAVRFITEPELAQEFDYVYIGDIDILILDEDIETKHVKNMTEYDAPFSNIVRNPMAGDEKEYRLSGSHFAPTDLQYPLPELDGIEYTANNSKTGDDERALYQIMERQGAMIPYNMTYRPVHGIHMRTHSHPFGRRVDRSKPEFSFEEIKKENQIVPWSGIERSKYRQRFLELLEEESFQDLYFSLDLKAKTLITVLENICHKRFQELEKECYTYVISESKRKQLARKTIQSFHNNGIKWTISNKILPRFANRFEGLF